MALPEGGLTMGSHNGTYVPWHEPVWSHAKTKAAAAVLVADPKARVPEEYASALVGRALHALSCWALRDGDTGSTARLTDAELAQIAWPEGVARARIRPAAIGALLRKSLRAGGFLRDVDGDERIHDFQDHCSHILSFRRSNRDTDHQRAAGLASAAARKARTGTAQPNRTPNSAEPGGLIPVRTETNTPGSNRFEPSASASASAHAERAPEPTSPDRGYATTPTSPQVEPPTGRSLRLPDKPAPDHEDPQEAITGVSELTVSGRGRSGRARAGRLSSDTHPESIVGSKASSVDPVASAGSEAHRLELTLGCSYAEASKAVQGLVIAGASLEWINARITASRGSTSTPWDWALHAKRAWADAFGEGAHIA